MGVAIHFIDCVLPVFPESVRRISINATTCTIESLHPPAVSVTGYWLLPPAAHRGSLHHGADQSPQRSRALSSSLEISHVPTRRHRPHPASDLRSKHLPLRRTPPDTAHRLAR